MDSAHPELKSARPSGPKMIVGAHCVALLAVALPL
jgi:hypothetical protein